MERRDIIPVRDDRSAVEGNEDERTVRLWDKSGAEDLTEEALPSGGDMLLLLMPELAEVTPAMTWKLNSLYDWSRDHDTRKWRPLWPALRKRWMNGLISPFRSMRYILPTTLQSREVARGNPAVVFLRDGNVIWKRTLSSVDVEDFMAPDIDLDPMNYAPDSRTVLLRRIWPLCGRNDFTCRYFADAKTVKPDRTKEPEACGGKGGLSFMVIRLAARRIYVIPR